MPLQKDKPYIHLLHGILVKQFTDLAVRFVKPSYNEFKNICKVDFGDNLNQKENKDTYIGTDTRLYLQQNESKCDDAQFFRDVRAYQFCM